MKLVPVFSPFSVSTHLYFFSAAFLPALCLMSVFGFSWEKVTVWAIKESYEEVLDVPEVSVSVAFHSKLLWHLHGLFSPTAVNKSCEQTSQHEPVQETLNPSLSTQAAIAKFNINNYNKHTVYSDTSPWLRRIRSDPDRKS